MWRYLLHLSAQQTTAPELAAFLVVVTLACIVMAALLYIAIMTGAWAIALRPSIHWHDAVFPSLPRLGQFKWEYALAALTSLALTATLVEKDQLVDSVLALPADKFLDDRVTAGLFPLHRVPDNADLGGTSLAEEIRRQGNLQLGALVREPLEAGRSGEVRALLAAGVGDVLAKHPTWHALLTRGLTLACVLLILGYVAWLSTRRVHDLRVPAGDAEDRPYRNVLGRIAVLGTCLALLLAVPSVAQDAELLADSALAAARHTPPPATPQLQRVDSLVAVGIDRQYQLQAIGAGTDTLLRRFTRENAARLADISARLAAVPDWSARLATHEERLGRLGDSLQQTALGSDLRAVRISLDSLRRRLASFPDPSARLAAHEARLDKLDGALPPLQVMLDSLRTRGLLLVQTDRGQSYVVTPARNAAMVAAGTGVQVVGQGATTGLHWVPPGRYTVSETGTNGIETVTVRAGEAIAVVVTARIP